MFASRHPGRTCDAIAPAGIHVELPIVEYAMSSLRIVATLLSVLALPAVAGHTPRAQVAGVAHAIEACYFDADRGRQFADGLRAAADAGSFDAMTDPEAVASALTARLKPLDRHFRVQVAHEGDAGSLRDAGSAPGRMSAPARRMLGPGGDGIERVDILPGNIGLLALREFADFEFGRDDQPPRQAIDAALQRLSATDATVIDLRGNHGGAPAMVGYLASAFVPRGAKIFNIFHGREGTQSEAPLEWHATPRTRVPLFVLVDAHTGSAAESFAYTLQQARRATIVGEPSGGAANPGGPVATPEGLVVFVPTATPVNPVSHGNWEGTGVQPDLRATSAAALDAALGLARKAGRG